MLDIVAAHDHKLAMTIQIIGVYDAQTRLTRTPAPAPQAPSKQKTIEKNQNKSRQQEGRSAKNPEEHFVVADHVGHKLHTRPALARAKWLSTQVVILTHKAKKWVSGVKQWLISLPTGAPALPIIAPNLVQLVRLPYE